MKYMTVGNELEGASQLVLGCMRLAEHAPEEVVSVLETALEGELISFDHSDVYAGGQSEAKFAQALRSAKIPGTEFSSSQVRTAGCSHQLPF